MSAGIYNFTIEQGTTVVKQFTYKDSNAAIVDLTDYDARMQIRSTHDAATPIATFTTGSNGGLSIVTSPSSATKGTVELRIEASATTAYDFTTAVYDIEIENTATNTVTRLLQGTIKLSKQVTR